jgi:tetratricopeptide (TPR) repeat protein
VLGHRREADVPSWAIPSLYVAYLREGEVGPMRRVFSHNRHDLLSLAALMTHLGRRLAEPLAQRLGPDELLAVARLYDEIGRRAEALECLELALELGSRATDASSLRERVQLALALLCRRAGRRDRAYELWRELAGGPAAITGLIELAKHHEHRERDSRAALDCVEQALAILELREARDGTYRWRAERNDLERRLARLLRKRGHG